MSLWQDFLTNDRRVINKWRHYFPVYERHFGPWRDREVLFWEIGVGKGGSMRMWQRYFGPFATIVGLDINPASDSLKGPGIHVRIGDQSDTEFLQRVIDEFGVPDVVLDDGSHRMEHIRATFDFVYPQLPKNGVYLVEDLHTAYWERFGGGVGVPESFMEFAKGCVDKLNHAYTDGAVEADHIATSTRGISFYDSMVCFEKGTMALRAPLRTGKIPRPAKRSDATRAAAAAAAEADEAQPSA